VVFYYRDDGSVRSKVTVKNKRKHGPSYNYYGDGTVQMEINYREGVKQGVARYFHESGKLYRETNYKDGLINGMRRYYYKSGSIKAEVPYKNGFLQEGTIEYTGSGKVISDYPEIIIKKVRASNNINYNLKISLDPPKSKVTYYLELQFEGGVGRIDLENYTREGIVNFPFERLPPVANKIQVKAEIKSRRGIYIILSKDLKLIS
jgi:hypothetical protein